MQIFWNQNNRIETVRPPLSGTTRWRRWTRRSRDQASSAPGLVLHQSALLPQGSPSADSVGLWSWLSPMAQSHSAHQQVRDLCSLDNCNCLCTEWWWMMMKLNCGTMEHHRVMPWLRWYTLAPDGYGSIKWLGVIIDWNSANYRIHYRMANRFFYRQRCSAAQTSWGQATAASRSGELRERRGDRHCPSLAATGEDLPAWNPGPNRLPSQPLLPYVVSFLANPETILIQWLCPPGWFLHSDCGFRILVHRRQHARPGCQQSRPTKAGLFSSFSRGTAHGHFERESAVHWEYRAGYLRTPRGQGLTIWLITHHHYRVILSSFRPNFWTLSMMILPATLRSHSVSWSRISSSHTLVTLLAASWSSLRSAPPGASQGTQCRLPWPLPRPLYQ